MFGDFLLTCIGCPELASPVLYKPEEGSFGNICLANF
jgi:hypothetical protein